MRLTLNHLLHNPTKLHLHYYDFNLFNLSISAAPDMLTFSTSFSRILSTVTPARQIQLGVRLTF